MSEESKINSLGETGVVMSGDRGGVGRRAVMSSITQLLAVLNRVEGMDTLC